MLCNGIMKREIENHETSILDGLLSQLLFQNSLCAKIIFNNGFNAFLQSLIEHKNRAENILDPLAKSRVWSLFRFDLCFHLANDNDGKALPIKTFCRKPSLKTILVDKFVAPFVFLKGSQCQNTHFA